MGAAAGCGDVLRARAHPRAPATGRRGMGSHDSQGVTRGHLVCSLGAQFELRSRAPHHMRLTLMNRWWPCRSMTKRTFTPCAHLVPSAADRWPSDAAPGGAPAPWNACAAGPVGRAVTCRARGRGGRVSEAGKEKASVHVCVWGSGAGAPRLRLAGQSAGQLMCHGNMSAAALDEALDKARAPRRAWLVTTTGMRWRSARLLSAAACRPTNSPRSNSWQGAGGVVGSGRGAWARGPQQHGAERLRQMRACRLAGPR